MEGLNLQANWLFKAIFSRMEAIRKRPTMDLTQEPKSSQSWQLQRSNGGKSSTTTRVKTSRRDKRMPWSKKSTIFSLKLQRQENSSSKLATSQLTEDSGRPELTGRCLRLSRWTGVSTRQPDSTTLAKSRGSTGSSMCLHPSLRICSSYSTSSCTLKLKIQTTCWIRGMPKAESARALNWASIFRREAVRKPKNLRRMQKMSFRPTNHKLLRSKVIMPTQIRYLKRKKTLFLIGRRLRDLASNRLLKECWSFKAIKVSSFHGVKGSTRTTSKRSNLNEVNLWKTHLQVQELS